MIAINLPPSPALGYRTFFSVKYALVLAYILKFFSVDGDRGVLYQ